VLRLYFGVPVNELNKIHKLSNHEEGDIIGQFFNHRFGVGVFLDTK
jgi:hypothetical protein